MQIFDFRCQDCDHRFEEWDNSDRTAKPTCPNCDSANTIRLISAPRFDLDGMVASGSATSDGMTTAVDRWAKRREQHMKIEARNKERHGTYD
mgnify:FL=1